MASTCSRVDHPPIVLVVVFRPVRRKVYLFTSPIGQSDESMRCPHPASAVCHARQVSYSDVVWLPNALIMTALLAAFAVWRWRSKGPLIGLRWVGVAMLPLALYAIGLFRLVWTVGLAVSRFVTGFVFRPSVWIGLVLAVLAVGLILLPSKVAGRDGAAESKTPKALKVSKKSAGDDDMSEIEDILKKHGLG
jgi:hypothetical protein